ncbi:hypothetical protein [Arthrobacter sp. MMS18-M83]|uniref:hypothetical protein n=1 Tax=Arthrobacter sp. MMS18-M83 TaxID=2996261 RepID=UPI00227AF1C2|nr:hypothetical protein [Arthrobacter sp. MMS18-M83]WAH98839.1 hypothetical protein OW521_08415 [Arthrobacter sp. MMS18-M83]
MTAITALPSDAAGLPDFVHGQVENFAAHVVCEDLAPALSKEANFFALRITAQGLEVILSSPPTPAQIALINTESQPTVQARIFSKNHLDPATVPHVPICFRTVPNSMATLMALTHRLVADAPSWAAKGINLSAVGPDVVSDTVVVHLAKYSPAAASVLVRTYGSLLQVAPKSRSVSPSDRFSDSPQLIVST